MRNSPFTFAPWLPLLFHHTHWDQTEESLCPSLGSRPTLAQGPSAHVPLLFGTTFHYLSVQPPRLPPSEDVSKHTFSTWSSPVDTGVPNCLLMLRNDFNDFAFEHRSGCCTTEPGYAGDIGDIEIWLIDWYVWSVCQTYYPCQQNGGCKVWQVCCVCIKHCDRTGLPWTHSPPRTASPTLYTGVQTGAITTCCQYSAVHLKLMSASLESSCKSSD